VGQQPAPAEHRQQRQALGEKAGELEPRAQQKEHAGYRFAQKRVAVSPFAGQQGIAGRKIALLGNGLDEGQVHGQVAVGALAAPVGAAL